VAGGGDQMVAPAVYDSCAIHQRALHASRNWQKKTPNIRLLGTNYASITFLILRGGAWAGDYHPAYFRFIKRISPSTVPNSYYPVPGNVTETLTKYLSQLTAVVLSVFPRCIECFVVLVHCALRSNIISTIDFYTSLMGLPFW